MTIRVIIWWISAVSSCACAPRFGLQLPSASEAVDGRAGAAVAGVRVVTDTDEWAGEPRALTDVIAVQVTIENESGRPLRLGYQEFALSTPSGERLAALPSVDIKQTVAPRSYPYAWNGFHVAPHMSSFYRGFWNGWDFEHDPQYYETQYREMKGLMQPTADMARKALPEGVLEPGGCITGFLYFRGDDVSTRVTFSADLVDADSSQEFANVRVPMLVDGD